jgi:hypothetical protein
MISSSGRPLEWIDRLKGELYYHYMSEWQRGLHVPSRPSEITTCLLDGECALAFSPLPVVDPLDPAYDPLVASLCPGLLEWRKEGARHLSAGICHSRRGIGPFMLTVVSLIDAQGEAHSAYFEEEWTVHMVDRKCRIKPLPIVAAALYCRELRDKTLATLWQ